MTDREPTSMTEEKAPEDETGPAPPNEGSEGGAPGATDTHSGSLLDPETGDGLELEDRKRPIPGGEPECPRCGKKMIRRVERFPAPQGGTSPFRVRLVCRDAACGAWTVYHW